MRILIALFALGLLSGCGLRSFSKQTVLLAPKVEVSESRLGQNKKVSLTVLDERPEPIVGHRAAGGGLQGAVISTKPEPTAIIMETVKKGLMRQGFEVLQEPQTGVAKLEIQLRALDYRTASDALVLKVSVNTAAKVEVTHGPDHRFQKMFTASETRSPFIVPDSDSNAEHINAVLSSLLNQMLNDRSFLDSLTI